MLLSQEIAMRRMLMEVGAEDPQFQKEHEQIRFTLLGESIRLVYTEPGMTPMVIYWGGKQYASFGPLKATIRHERTKV